MYSITVVDKSPCYPRAALSMSVSTYLFTDPDQAFQTFQLELTQAKVVNRHYQQDVRHVSLANEPTTASETEG